MQHNKQLGNVQHSRKKTAQTDIKDINSTPLNLNLIKRGNSLMKPSDILQLQSLIGNQAVQRMLMQTSNVASSIQRTPETTYVPEGHNEDTVESNLEQVNVETSETSIPSDALPIAEQLEAKITELFEQYEQLKVTVPDGLGGQVSVSVKLSYFINSFQGKNITALKALREAMKTEELGEKDKETLHSLEKQELRKSLHLKALSAIRGELNQLDNGKEIKGLYKGGKGAPHLYQTFIQTAIDKAIKRQEANKKINKLPQPGTTPAEWQANIQAWIITHHVGVDCTGMVNHILDTLLADPELGLTRLKKKERIALETLGELRAGDVLGKKGSDDEVGHVRLVQRVEEVTDESGNSWFEITLIESSSGKHGAFQRILRIPVELSQQSISEAYKKLEEQSENGKWKRAGGERKKYKPYRTQVEAVTE